MKTIKDVEKQLEERVFEALEELNLKPKNYDCNVRLHGQQRDKKSNASFENSWSPDTDTIRIEFHPTMDEPRAGSQSGVTGPPDFHIDAGSQPSPSASDPVSDLIRALDRAEAHPGFKFVALKWFRDTALPEEGFAWATDHSARQRALSDAIKKRLILTNSEPNPKAPQFPVTTIRLNRWMPEVKIILGIPDDRMSDFQPVQIRGENLSMTVLQDRR